VVRPSPARAPLIVLRVRWHGPPGAGVPAARSTTAAVTTRAASAGAHIRARKSAPLRCSWPRTIRFGGSSRPGTASPHWTAAGTPTAGEPRPLPVPGGVRQHRRQERDRGIQVQRRGRDADHDARAREQRAPLRAIRASWRPSSLATRPISSSPVTRTNGDQSCDATSPAIPVPASSQERRSAKSPLSMSPLCEAVRQLPSP
jgi:hypothetical protein